MTHERNERNAQSNDQVPVVTQVVCRHQGAAEALERRATQTHCLVYGLKQYIHFLYKTCKIYNNGFQSSAASLIPIKSLLHNKQSDFTSGELLSPHGIVQLIQELQQSDEKFIEGIQRFNNPMEVLKSSILDLNQIVKELENLKRGGIGKAQQKQEKQLCMMASELNNVIGNLHSACEGYMVTDAYSEPYTACRNAEYRTKVFLHDEYKYATSCLKLQSAVQQLEEKVFKFIQELQLKYAPVMSAMIGNYNDTLEQIETRERSDPLTDWNNFESRNAESMIKEFNPIVINFSNHPQEEQFRQFQITRFEDIEISHRLDSMISKDYRISTAKRWLGQAMSILLRGKRRYAVRGVWTVSTTGRLIEYDENNHQLLGMFSLTDCQIGLLEPDRFGIFGYFTLTGSKIHQVGEKLKQGKVKDYKFRGELENVKRFHGILCQYWLGHQI